MQTVTVLEGAPPVPSIRLNLRQASMWERVREKAKALDPTQLLGLYMKEEERIRKRATERGYVTAEEADVLNRIVANRVDAALRNLKAEITETLTFNEGDDANTVEIKIAASQHFADWIAQLAAWITKKLKQIFEQAKKALQWCQEKLSELFEYLYAYLADNLLAPLL
jgi:DNA-directed RNA polymerase subunit F